MGWLLGFFKCAGIPNTEASHRHRQRSKNQVGSGRPSSAAVAHATSPEDLHKVRRLRASSAVSNGYNERELFNSQAQAKKCDMATRASPKCNNGSKMDLLNRQSLRETQLHEELESLRMKLILEADVTKKLSDEVKYLKACQSLLEFPSRSFKATFDSLEKSSSGSGEHTWVISSVTSTKPLSPLHSLKEGCLLRNRDPKKGDNGNTLDDSNMLKCAKLNQFRVKSNACDEVEEGFDGSFALTQSMEERKPCAVPSQLNAPSSQWTFSKSKLLHSPFWTFASSEDLLLEHLEVSSLIEDPILVKNWEHSLGERILEQGLAHEHFLDSFDVPGQEVSNVGDAELHFSARESQQGEEDGAHRPDPGSGHSLEVPLMEEMVFPGADVALNSSSPIPMEAEVQRGFSCARSLMNAQEGKDSIVDIETRSFPGAFYGENDGESATQDCFSSQFRLSKRLWGSTRKNPSDREASIPLVAGCWHHGDNDMDEVLLPCTHAKMQKLQALNYELDTHQLGMKQSAEHMAEPTMSTEQPWFLVNTASQSLAESIKKGTDSTPQFVAVEDDTRFRNWSVETSIMKALEQGEVPARRDESLETGPMETMKQHDEALARTFPAQDQYEAQRKRSRLRLSESVRSNQDEGGYKVEHEHEEKVCLLDSMGEASHESISEEEANLLSNDMVFKSVENGMLYCPHNETSSNLNSDSLSPHLGMQKPAKLVNSHRYHLIADDRPILGTVAAHWSPVSTTRKWWDGKGIPNSTSKYKEDQQVSWHAVPFEVRLEQALANHDSLLSK